MKKLDEILQNVKVLKVTGNTDISVSGISFDSRKAIAGNLFTAVKGTKNDGHDYIREAMERGCTVIVCERLPDKLKKEITYIRVRDSGIALGRIASNFFSSPSKHLTLVGVTGTNGKTTIATLLYQVFRRLGYRAGLISTIQDMIQDEVVNATHTTPDAVSINDLLSRMVETGCEYCFMEVSSHAISQHRIEGLRFRGGIFTNITHDHLDYHGNFRDYVFVKKRFFDQLPANAFALIDMDDKNGKVMVQNTQAKVHTYSLRSASDFKCRILESYLDGMLLRIGNNELWTQLIGDFNAYNILAVYGCSVLLGQATDTLLPVISELKPVKGRAETITSDGGITAVIDYAHTPDALENILSAVGRIRKENQKIITVVGAGGDRDRLKRPVMGKIAALNSDRVILTSDNPRSEIAEDIISEMKGGISDQMAVRVICITDRREAIKTAFMSAGEGDIIVVAGKGHENYQEIMGKKIHFDDREVIMDIIQK